MNVLVTVLALLAAAGLWRAWTFHRRAREFPSPETFIIEPPVEATVTRLDPLVLQIQMTKTDEPWVAFADTDPDTLRNAVALVGSVAHARGRRPANVMLGPNQRYYFAIMTRSGDRVITAERFLSLKGAVNFRDLGGYATVDGRRTRWGRVFRSGALAHLTEGEQRYLQALGVKLVCDLRSPEEAAEEPDRLPEGITYRALPLQTDDKASRRRRLLALLFSQKNLTDIMFDAYTRIMIDGNAQLIGQVIRYLADEDNLPAVVHCTAGKDRAGIAAAFVLLALGVPEETVLADYSLSNHYYASFLNVAARAIKPLAPLGVKARDLTPLLVANPALLRAAFDYVRDRYGSVDAYLRDAAGVDDDLRARLQAALLE